MTIKEKSKLRGLLNRPLATLEADPITGEKVRSEHTTGIHYIAQFEIDKILKEFSDITN